MSCENEPVGIYTVSPDDVIEVNSDLYGTLQSIAQDEPLGVTACIEFVYNFTINVYNSDLEIIDFEIMYNDEDLILFLDSVEDGNSISLSYPIEGTLADGENLVINNNDDLKENLKACLKEETIFYCNGLLEECVWKVTYFESEIDTYEDSYFDVSSTGNAWLNWQDEVYQGTWINYYIEDQLHLNINLSGSSQVTTDWNDDWLVTILNESQIKITNENFAYILEKECFTPCKQLVFEECKLNEESETATFYLETYIECFISYSSIEDIADVNISFHLTNEDAINDTNPIETTEYINTENPQIIYVRFEDVLTEEYIDDLIIFLVAIDCY